MFGSGHPPSTPDASAFSLDQAPCAAEPRPSPAERRTDRRRGRRTPHPTSCRTDRPTCAPLSSVVPPCGSAPSLPGVDRAALLERCWVLAFSETKHEPRATVVRTLKAHRAAVRLRDVLHDREPESRPRQMTC